jgi:hypothetical protein
MNRSLVIVVAATILLLSSLVVFALRRFAGKNWIRTEGRIERSEIVPLSRRTLQELPNSDRADKYRLDIEYVYQVAGVEYRSGNILRGAPNIFETEFSAQKARETYPAGQTVPVFYNSRTPSQSALWTPAALSVWAWLCLQALVILVMSIISVVFLVQIGVIDMRALVARLSGRN